MSKASSYQTLCIAALTDAGRPADRIIDVTGIPERVVRQELRDRWKTDGKQYQRDAVRRLADRGLTQRQIANGLCAPEVAVQHILFDELFADEVPA